MVIAIAADLDRQEQRNALTVPHAALQQIGETMTRPRWPLTDLYSAFSNLAVESSAVVGLRMLAAVQGGPSWPAEARLMVDEKTKAALDAHTLFVASVLTGTTASAPTRALALYRRRVKANRRRLTGKR